MASEDGAAASRRWGVLAVSSVASFMTPFDASVVNLALPSIAASLDSTLIYIVWIPTVYLVTIAALQTAMGRLGDMVEKKRLFLAGLSVFTVGSLGAAVSQSVLELIGARVMQGVGAATMSVVGLSILVRAFPAQERGRAVGMNTMATYGGLTTGPVIGGLLVQDFGWRSIFYVNIPIALCTGALGAVYLWREKSQSSRRFDVLGAALFAVFLGALVLGVSQNELGWSQQETAVLDLLCAAAFLLFLLTERRRAERDPLVDLGLFTHNRPFSAGIATAMMNYLTSAATLLILSLYLQSVLGYSPVLAGLILLAQPVLMMLSTPVAGALSDRIPAGVLSSVGMAAKVAGFLLLSLLGTGSPPEAVWAPLLLVGFGHGFFSSPNVNSVMSSVEPARLGLASGTLGTTRTASQSIGIAAFGAIVAAAMPAGAFSQLSGGGVYTGLAQFFVDGMRVAFTLAAALSAIGVVTSLLRGKKEEAPPRERPDRELEGPSSPSKEALVSDPTSLKSEIERT